MINLAKDMLLYHGSYTEISSIDLSYSKRRLDFGRGFYLTSSYEQAKRFVPSSVNKNIRTKVIPADFKVEDGRISVYRFQPDKELLIHIFASADIEWLHYVAASRKPSIFPGLLDQYEHFDIIGGKVANDATAATLVEYVSSTLHKPGEEAYDREIISKLLPDRLADQFCFRTFRSLEALEFVRSDRYGDNR